MANKNNFSCKPKESDSFLRKVGIMLETAFLAQSALTTSSSFASAYFPALHNKSIANLAFPVSEKPISAIEL